MGELFGGLMSIFTSDQEAPKVNTFGAQQAIQTPFYSLKDGKLISRGATSPSGFKSMLSGLQSNQTDIMGMRSNIAPIRNALGGISGNLSDLYGQVRPGFGRLTDAKVRSIRDAAAASIGDLRTQMARRGVLGSSFANDTETRTNLAFAREEERARAEAIIGEIGLSTEIIQKQLATQALTLGANEEERAILAQSAQNYIAQANTLGQEITAELNQLGLAGQLTNQSRQILMQGAIQQAQLDFMQANINNAALVGGITSVANSLPQFASMFGGGMGGGMAAAGADSGAIMGALR